MKTSRLIVFILLIGGIIGFFLLQADLDENGRWGLVGANLLLAIIWVYLADGPKPVKRPGSQGTVTPVKVKKIEEVSVDIPEVVTKDELDGASLRETKDGKGRR